MREKGGWDREGERTRVKDGRGGGMGGGIRWSVAPLYNFTCLSKQMSLFQFPSTFHTVHNIIVITCMGGVYTLLCIMLTIKYKVFKSSNSNISKFQIVVRSVLFPPLLGSSVHVHVHVLFIFFSMSISMPMFGWGGGGAKCQKI